MKFHFVLMSGKNPGMTAKFEQPVVILGRDPSCDLPFSPRTWPDLPAQFAKVVEREQKGASVLLLQYMVDENSPDYGTIIVNNELMIRESVVLSHDDVIKLGEDGPVIRFRNGVPSLGQQPPPAEPKVSEFDAKLQMITGSFSGREFNLSNQGVQRVGRHPSMEVALDPNDVLISGCHATIIYKDGEWCLTDKSRHRTLVNGRIVETAVLNNNDLIGFGQYGPQARFLCSDNPLQKLVDKRSSIRKTPERSAPGISAGAPKRKRLRVMPLLIGAGVVVVVASGIWGLSAIAARATKAVEKESLETAAATPTPTSTPKATKTPFATPKPPPPTPVAPPTAITQLPTTKVVKVTPSVTPMADVPPPVVNTPAATPTVAPTVAPTAVAASLPRLTDSAIHADLQFPNSSWSFRKVPTSDIPASAAGQVFYDVVAPSQTSIRFTFADTSESIAKILDRMEAGRRAQGSTNIARNANSLYFQSGSDDHRYVAYVKSKSGKLYGVSVSKKGARLNSAEQKEVELFIGMLAQQQ